MTEFLTISVIIALAAAFVVLLVKKWGIAAWMQMHGDKYLSQLFSCDLCMSFWASVVLMAGVLCVTDNALYILVPVLTTPITRMLV